MNKLGRRIYPNSDGKLYLSEGDYGKHPTAGWQGRPFGFNVGSFNNHEVTEHEDGTITVSPSILLLDSKENGEQIVWHGYLEHGFRRDA